MARIYEKETFVGSELAFALNLMRKFNEKEKKTPEVFVSRHGGGNSCFEIVAFYKVSKKER
jgi:hypothetical protein